MGGLFVLPKRSFWPSFFSKVVARLQWNPAAIDLTRTRAHGRSSRPSVAAAS